MEINYEQKYKEALARAKEQLDGVTVFDYDNEQIAHDIRTTVCNIFPELKESEDERIKKAIHIYLDWLDGRKDYAPKGEYSIRDMIAWLEKRGQSKRTSIWKHWKDGIAGNGDGIPAFLIKNGLSYSLSPCLVFECDYIELSELDSLMLEKQGNNADKVKQQQTIEIPFGAKDSELQEATYYIPDGYHAEINGNEVVIKKSEIKSCKI